MTLKNLIVSNNQIHYINHALWTLHNVALYSNAVLSFLPKKIIITHMYNNISVL